MAGSLRAGPCMARTRRVRAITCSALMAGSLRAGFEALPLGIELQGLAVPSWRAVSVPGRVPHPKSMEPWACSALMAGSLRAGDPAPHHARPLVLPCSALMAGSLRAGWPSGLTRRAPRACSALMAGSLRAGSPSRTRPAPVYSLAVPSWRAVSVPGEDGRPRSSPASSCSALMAGSLRAGYTGFSLWPHRHSLQCPHGGQSPCRNHTANGAGAWHQPLQCPHGGQSPCRAAAGRSPTRSMPLAVPSWRAVSVPAPRRCVRHGCGRHLAVPSWRAVSVPVRCRQQRHHTAGHLQCPHGGQSPCRGRLWPSHRISEPSCSALMAGSLRAGQATAVRAVATVTPCSALMAGSLRAGRRSQSPADTPPTTCSALMAGSLRAGCCVAPWRRALPLSLQCPHGGQSPCRRSLIGSRWQRAPLAVPSWRAVSVPESTNQPPMDRAPRACSALMAGSLRAGRRARR